MLSGIRVLHVIPSVGPFRGGPSVTMRAIARSLADANLAVHVATTDDNGHARLGVPLGIPIVDAGVTYRYFRRQTHFYTVSWPLTRWLARHIGDYDLIHIHALFSWATVAAAFQANRQGVPYVIRPLGTLDRWGLTHRRRLLKRLSFKLLDLRILAGAARVHFTSERERLEAAELGITERVALVPIGVDFAGLKCARKAGWLERRAPHLAGRKVVLSFSRLDPIKGLDLLLCAFSRLRQSDPGLALVIAGSGAPHFEAGLRAKALRLGIESDILWAGFLEGRDKAAAFAEADVFVLPSFSESFGIAVVEAMACAVPVVISDQVGIHPEVAAAGAGLVVPCRLEALVEAIQHMVADPDLRRRTGSAGRRLALERFSIGAMTAGLMEMYEQVLRSTGRWRNDGLPIIVERRFSQREGND